MIGDGTTVRGQGIAKEGKRGLEEMGTGGTGEWSGIEGRGFLTAVLHEGSITSTDKSGPQDGTGLATLLEPTLEIKSN